MLAATPYTVINLNASGVGSLAAAISSANHQASNPEGSVIQFAQGLNGVITTPTTLDLSETDGPEQIVGNNAVTISGGNTVGVFSVASATTATFSNLTITDGNTANSGGGITLGTNYFSTHGVQGSTVTVTNCIISNNTATVLGGGIFADFYCHLTVVNSTIDNNIASGGGGIMNRDGHLVVSGSTISNNTSTGIGNYVYVYGGGIYDNGPYIGGTGPYGVPSETIKGIANISNTTIIGNIAPQGGGLYVNGGLATVTNSTIVNNHATASNGYGGSGIYAFNDTSVLPSVVVNNTILIHNTDTAGNAVGGADDIAGGAYTGSYNLVGNDDSGKLTGGTGNQVWVANPGLGILANNGGSTLTVALLTGSPAIGAGSVALAVDINGQPLTTDQTGNPRFTNNHVDIGAVEFVAIVTLPLPPTSLVANASNGNVTLNWAASSGATSYNIYRSTTSGAEGSTPYRTGITTASFADTGLTNGTTYYYQVSAVNTAGVSNRSSEVFATPTSSQLVTAIDAGGGASGTYLADTGFTGGTTATSTHLINTSGVTNPASQVVYDTERYGNFTYTISGLTAGANYTARLHFAETYWTAAGRRSFNVLINGTQVLTNFDIFASAGGMDIAIVRQFTAVANSSGRVVIQFTTVVDNAKLSGLEIFTATATVPSVPTGLVATTSNGSVTLNWTASPGATSYNVYRSTTSGAEGSTPYRTSITTTSFTDTGLINGIIYYYQASAVNTVGESNKSSEVSATPLRLVTAVDAGGGASGTYLADTGFTGGRAATSTNLINTSSVTNPAPQAVYDSERVGNFTYTVTGLTAGSSYTVRLHFAEFYWNAAGARSFNVLINNAQVLTNFDIFAAAGGRNVAIVRQFTAVADSSGRVTIQFVTVTDNAKLSGLEILSV